MNIFILDKDIRLSAKYHCDKHVVKMILECTQLLSTALRLTGVDQGYRLTHKNHPCSIWTRNSLSNFNYVKTLAKHLNSEYRFRYNKSQDHKSFNLIQSLPVPNIEDKGITSHPLCMPDQYKTNCVIDSYRAYYINEKKNILQYRSRDLPPWIDNQG